MDVCHLQHRVHQSFQGYLAGHRGDGTALRHNVGAGQPQSGQRAHDDRRRGLLRPLRHAHRETEACAGQKNSCWHANGIGVRKGYWRRVRQSGLVEAGPRRRNSDATPLISWNGEEVTEGRSAAVEDERVVPGDSNIGASEYPGFQGREDRGEVETQLGREESVHSRGTECQHIATIFGKRPGRKEQAGRRLVDPRQAQLCNGVGSSTGDVVDGPLQGKIGRLVGAPQQLKRRVNQQRGTDVIFSDKRACKGNGESFSAPSDKGPDNWNARQPNGVCNHKLQCIGDIWLEQ